MASISLFLPYIRTVAEGCPDLIIEQQIQHTIADFCERSLCLKTEKTIDLVANTASYNVAPAVGTEVVKILNLYVDGKPIDTTSVDEMDESVPDWRTRTGTVIGYLQDSHEDVLLVYIPTSDITGGIRFRYAYRPSILTTDFPDMLYERWFEGILAGAKARVFSITGKPWSDPAQASYLFGMYENAVGAAAAMGAKQFGRAPLRVRACP
jgi:hypothetical protein